MFCLPWGTDDKKDYQWKVIVTPYHSRLKWVVQPQVFLIEKLSVLRCHTQTHMRMCLLSCSCMSPVLMKHCPYPLPSLSLLVFPPSRLGEDQSTRLTQCEFLSFSPISLQHFICQHMKTQAEFCLSSVHGSWLFLIVIPIWDRDFVFGRVEIKCLSCLLLRGVSQCAASLCKARNSL